MSFEEYSKIKHETPYFYIVRSNEQILYYFGTQHSIDPNHPQFNLLKQKWNEFLNEAKAKKTLVLVERNIKDDKQNTLEESISKYGESGAGMYFAFENSSEFKNPEPKIEEIVTFLLKNYSKEEILYFYESIAINHWQKNKIQQNINEFLSKNNEKYKKLLDWANLKISFDLLKEIHKKIFGQELDINDQSFFSQVTNPVTIKSRINELSRSQSIYRNEYILGQIEKYWSNSYNIFVVYGASHAVMQRPAIESLIV